MNPRNCATLGLLLGGSLICNNVVQAYEHAVSAPGRIEGASRTSTLSFATAGRVEQVNVAEGQSVGRGTVLARLDCAGLEAAIEQHQARVDEARSALKRVQRGARSEERAIAEARVAATQAKVVRLRRIYVRLKQLTGTGSYASEAELEDSLLQTQEAEAQLTVATRQAILAKSTAPQEELAEATAKVTAAEAGLLGATEQRKDCQILAPTDGMVVRRHVEIGEFVNNFYPSPAFSFVGSGAWKVRAEVDEADVGLVHIGQAVQVHAKAFGEMPIVGKVVQKASVMGRRQVLSGDPGEKMDRDIMEVLIELSPPTEAPPLGLRVRAVFDP